MPAITTGQELLRPQDTNWSTRYFDSMTLSTTGFLFKPIETNSWKECIVDLTIANTATVSFVESNDYATWTPINSTLNLATGAQGGTVTGSGKFSVPLAARFFCVQVTAWTSGAVSCNTLFNVEQTILFNQVVTYRSQLTTQLQTILTTTTETTIIPASGAAIFNDIGWLLIANTSATGVSVDIRSATGGAVRATIAVPASTIQFMQFNAVPFIQSSPNNNWTAQLSAAVTDVRITVGAAKNTI